MSTISQTDVGDTNDVSNVLLLASAVGDEEDRACGKLLEAGAGDRTHAMFFTCRHSPADRLSIWEEVDAGEAIKSVVDVNTVTRSAVATRVAATEEIDAHVESVQDPTDLIRVGTTLDGLLRDLPEDGAPVLCFHSVTDLLQYAEDKEVFKFLEVLTGNIEQAGATAHYHMDPHAHDVHTLQTFEDLFDETVDVRDEDEAR